MVRALAALRPPLLAPVVLIRHAPAGQRWPVADTDRPLTPGGVRRAGAMADVLPTFAPTRLRSASPLRCRQTLEPLAQRLRLAVEVDPVFDEDASPRAASRRLAELSGDATTVVCSQGALIPPKLWWGGSTARRPERLPHPRRIAERGSFSALFMPFQPPTDAWPHDIDAVSTEV